MLAALRPHTARYDFVDLNGTRTGTEEMSIAPRVGGWLAVSHLELTLPEPLICDVEWHLEPDLSTHIVYLTTTDHWQQEYHLEAAVTGNGLIASRSGADGPTQVEMGWGPEVELDHVSAAFTMVLLARWDIDAAPQRRVTSVYIPVEDLLPEPLEQEYRVLGRSDQVTEIERLVPSTGNRARVSVLPGGVVRDYQGLFAVADWSYTDLAPAPPTK